MYKNEDLSRIKIKSFNNQVFKPMTTSQTIIVSELNNNLKRSIRSQFESGQLDGVVQNLNNYIEPGQQSLAKSPILQSVTQTAKHLDLMGISDTMKFILTCSKDEFDLSYYGKMILFK